jgi:MoaA/NifB/PqqE/SkfB family radical SAM enzyme
MKIFRIKNRRNALATNSSSTHSVVYKNKEQVFEDLGIFDNRYYDRCTETIAASREAKIRYIFSNIFYWNELVDLMSEKYPEMKEYYQMAKEYFDIYRNEKNWDELSSLEGDEYWEMWKDLESYNFGDHCRGSLYNTDEIYLSYKYLCNIIDSPDIVIVGGSDEDDFVFDKISGCKRLSYEYTYLNKITDKVKNGNYYVLYGNMFHKKEKLRLQIDSIPDMIPEYPELVDMKITNTCEHKCPFCYMNSVSEGEHAKLEDIYRILRMFKIKTEFALGGGNVLLHPDFTKIVKHIHYKDHIVNITIRYDDTKTIENNKNIKRAIKKYVSGIGISVQKAKDVDVASDFIKEMLDLGKHVSLHIIPEMIGSDESVDIMNKMTELNDTLFDLGIENKCKVLLLGLKQSGRAKELKYDLLSDNELHSLEEASRYQFCVDTSFANTYEYFFKTYYNDCKDFFLTRNEGEFSMYIDAVNNKAYASSYKTDIEDGINIREEQNIKDVFGEIRRRNGFKVFEKPLPYYMQ